jgi:opacity protein-like surface antigen
VQVKPRPEYAVGSYAAVWGGGNLLQDGSPSIKDNFSLGLKQKLSLNDSVGFATGIKLGYIWKPDPISINYNPDKNQHPTTVLPSIEGEFIYSDVSDSNLSYNVSGGSIQQRFEMNIYAFTINPILRFQWGKFRPYFGVGFGGAYVEGKNQGIYAVAPGYPTTQVLPSGGSDSDIAFCFQAMAGTDYFLSQEWSVFLEYKYLGLTGLEFDKGLGGAATYQMGDVYGNHLVIAGIKYHF